MNSYRKSNTFLFKKMLSGLGRPLVQRAYNMFMFSMVDKTFEMKCDHLIFLWKDLLKDCSEINSHVIAALWNFYDLWLSSNCKSTICLFDCLYKIHSFPFFSQEMILSAVGRWGVERMRSQRNMYLEKCYFLLLHILYYTEKWNSICDLSVSACGTFKKWSLPIIWNP